MASSPLYQPNHESLMGEPEDYLEKLDTDFIEIFTALFTTEEILNGAAAFDYLDENPGARLG